MGDQSQGAKYASLVLVILITSCGNKGDLYITPDAVTADEQLQLERLQETLEPDSDLNTDDENNDSSKRQRQNTTVD